MSSKDRETFNRSLQETLRIQIKSERELLATEQAQRELDTQRDYLVPRPGVWDTETLALITELRQVRRLRKVAWLQAIMDELLDMEDGVDGRTQ